MRRMPKRINDNKKKLMLSFNSRFKFFLTDVISLVCYSNFSDIFDVEWFIATLAPDVHILKEIPRRLRITREMLYSTRAPRRSEPEHYIRYILPLLRRKKVCVCARTCTHGPQICIVLSLRVLPSYLTPSACFDSFRQFV